MAVAGLMEYFFQDIERVDGAEVFGMQLIEIENFLQKVDAVLVINAHRGGLIVRDVHQIMEKAGVRFLEDMNMSWEVFHKDAIYKIHIGAFIAVG